MAPEVMVALVGLAALVLYALLGGADFGGGIWVLLARGPRAEAQRQAIAHAMGPVWEANHVWLIFLIVLLFSCFPPAFAALSVAFFVPLHLVLVGIVLRGAAFVFRAHGATVERPNPHWTRLFGVASAFTPLILGLCLAAISSGRFRFAPGGSPGASGFWTPWLSPFSWTLGLFALAICAYLAAVYLTLETEGELQEDFRRRALGAGAVMAALAVLTLGVARLDAPRFWSQMLQPQAAPVLAGAGLLGLASTGAVLRRRYVWGRVAAAGQVTLVVLGWGIAQYPYLIYPDFPLSASAAPDPTLHLVLWSLIPGGLLLGPSLWLLFRVFKGGNPAAPAPTGSS
ncbi:MAG: cytochrome d ubiquinol oxidase subunit II [Actinomycetota bacterium]